MADQPIPGPPAEAQLAALEAGLKLHERIKKLTEEVEALRLEHPTEPTWEDRRWLGLLIGFSLLGACVGFIAGLSEHAGISEHLLTGVMTFVTGALLSYSGFRWRRGTEAARVDPLRVGMGVGGFSAFVIVGACFGVAARAGAWLGPLNAIAAPATAPGSATPPTEAKKEVGMRGDADPILKALNAGQLDEARLQCVQALRGELAVLTACAQVELELPAGDLDAAALARLGLSLKPGEGIFLDLKAKAP